MERYRKWRKIACQSYRSCVMAKGKSASRAMAQRQKLNWQGGMLEAKARAAIKLPDQMIVASSAAP